MAAVELHHQGKGKRLQEIFNFSHFLYHGVHGKALHNIVGWQRENPTTGANSETGPEQISATLDTKLTYPYSERAYFCP
jgi:hypothetical protein